ncbi:MAG: imidazoleglycerol-phosphate dehydratase HisB [Candidatus Omnitrophota bacterium]
MKKRISEVRRKTKETDISIKLNLDGTGKSGIATGIPFLNHMLELFAKHGLFDLIVKAKGDLEVDRHHTNEDIALLLGEAFKKALGDKKGIERFGSIAVPMDEVLAKVEVALDISGRPKLVFNRMHGESSSAGVDYNISDVEHFLESFVNASGITLHVETKGGRDFHHTAEAVFKALGVVLRMAVKINPRIKGVPSTKGRL